MDTATTSSMVSSATLPYLANTAACISMIPCILGICILISPQWGLDLLHFPTPTNAKDRTLVHGLMRMFAARNLAIGTLMLTIWQYGEGLARLTLLGLGMLATFPMAATDGWVSKVVTGGGQWQSWALVPVNAGIGLLL